MPDCQMCEKYPAVTETPKGSGLCVACGVTVGGFYELEKHLGKREAIRVFRQAMIEHIDVIEEFLNRESEL